MSQYDSIIIGAGQAGVLFGKGEFERAAQAAAKLTKKDPSNVGALGVGQRGDAKAQRDAAAELYLDPKLYRYIVDLVQATRDPKAYDNDLVQFGENVRERVNFICNCYMKWMIHRISLSLNKIITDLSGVFLVWN